MNDYTLEYYIESYLIHLEKERGYSSHSIINSQLHLNNLKCWSHYRGLYLVNQITTGEGRDASQFILGLTDIDTIKVKAIADGLKFEELFDK